MVQVSAAFIAVRKLYCPPQEWFDSAVLNEKIPARLESMLCRISGLLIILWVILLGFRPMMDNVDLGWHVVQGRWMVQHLSFYRHDVFNYPNLGHSVIDEYPLFQVVLYAAWSLGWWGPCLLTSIAYGLLAWLLLRAAKAIRLGSSALFYLCVVLMFVYLQVAFPLRPHMVTYLAVAILGIFLLRHRDATLWTQFWPMALLQIAWVNCHSGFIIGPAMVGLFGFEMTIRRWIETKAFPRASVKTWLRAALLITLACFVNPYGWSRFYLPFYQDQLESIRAYVGEMEPLYGGRLAVYSTVSFVTVIAVIAGLIARRGATAYSFLFLAMAFFFQAQHVQKAWPVFGVFVPLVILASGAFAPTRIPRKIEAWLNVSGHFAIAVIAGMAINIAANPSWPSSFEAQWKQVEEGRSELSVEAVKWMKTHGIEARLFHRCEDGGLLQLQGFDHGETFSDTGFGKYDEAFIHEVGLVNERPALIPRYLGAYKPDYIVCSNFCYQWPYYLLQSNCQLVFYSPNSSVWRHLSGSVTATAEPLVRKEAIRKSFEDDLKTNGLPNNRALLGRNIIALNSLGLEDFAFATLTGLPKEDHAQPWYWEAARILCFAQPTFSTPHRDALRAEAEALHEDSLTADFRANCLYAFGDIDGTLRVIGTISDKNLDNAAAELLLKIELHRKDPAALALARRTDCFDLRNGRHWMYLAQAEEQFGSIDAARAAWKKAVFYYPDDFALIQAASVFAAKYNDAALDQAMADSGKVYGVPQP